MPTGRERVDGLVREAAEWERADTKWDRKAALELVNETADTIAADLDRLEGMRRGLNELVVAGVISDGRAAEIAGMWNHEWRVWVKENGGGR